MKAWKKTIQCVHAVISAALTGLFLRPVYTPRYAMQCCVLVMNTMLQLVIKVL